MYDFLEKEIATELAPLTGLAETELRSLLKPPRERVYGDLAFPAFALAKGRRMAPQKIAEELAGRLQESISGGSVQVVTAEGGYVNFTVNAQALAKRLLPQILNEGQKYGSWNLGAEKTAVIDLSSPNIAKPFHVGHLRSTVLGSCLYRLYQKLGYRCVGINHLGDWGTQFGKLIVAYKKFATEKSFVSEPIYALLDLYLRFHKEARDHPELEEEARREFKKLEDGDPEARAIWKKCNDYSMAEYRRIYGILNATIDEHIGESFYNDKMEAAINRLSEKGLTQKSREALIVDLEAYGLGAALLRRSDEATLYLTRDLAALLYRKEKYDFSKALYVVGTAQSLHFKQLFKLIELLGLDWHRDCHHIDFGWIKFGTEMMSTREGNIVFLDDVIRKAVNLAAEIIREKNPDLDNPEEAAQAIGVGAIIYSDLKVRRHHDINFRWEDELNFDGNTGPYLQYTHTRLAGLERKYERPISAAVNFALLKEPEEKDLLMALYYFPARVLQAAEEFEPAVLCAYLYELSQILNSFYQKHRVITQDSDLSAARMLLMKATRTVMGEGLRLLGLKALEKM